MSTSRSRLTRSIQEIAKRDPDLRRAIEATKPRGDQPSASGVGTSDAERDRICCDGSVSNDANPGTETRDPTGGGQEGSLNSDDPAKLDMGEGTLSGVTDCATGEPICFEGSGFIPPEGWDDESSPPIDPNYQEGYFWQARFVRSASGSSWENIVDAQTCQEAISIIQEGIGCISDDDPNCGADNYIANCSPTGGRETAYQYLRISCTTQAICSEPPPAAEEWPSDGCTNLAIKGGSIVGSKYDPENDGSYSAPRDEIELCDGNGNQISLAPAANGGWKTINPTTDNGYLYNSKGEQIAHINGNEYSDPDI